MASPHPREPSQEITPPPPLRGTFLPRTGDPLCSPQHCDAMRGISKDHTVEIYLFHSPDLWWKTLGPLTDGHYSLLDDHFLRNKIAWPTAPWTVYNVEQRCWVDMPTFAHITVRPGEFLLLCPKSALESNHKEFAELNLLIRQLTSQYEQASPDITGDIPVVAAAPPDTPIRGPLHSVPRLSKRKPSEEPFKAVVSSSTDHIPRLPKRKKTEDA